MFAADRRMAGNGEHWRADAGAAGAVIATSAGDRGRYHMALARGRIVPPGALRTQHMSKSQDSKKNVKKKPQKTLLEKRAAKAEKAASKK